MAARAPLIFLSYQIITERHKGICGGAGAWSKRALKSARQTARQFSLPEADSGGRMTDSMTSSVKL